MDKLSDAKASKSFSSREIEKHTKCCTCVAMKGSHKFYLTKKENREKEATAFISKNSEVFLSADSIYHFFEVSSPNFLFFKARNFGHLARKLTFLIASIIVTSFLQQKTIILRHLRR